MTNLQITELLRNVAAAYQFKDQNKYKFQIIAYQKAADAIEHATSELKDLWDDGKLSSVPGVGPSIAQHLDDLFKNGKSKHFEEVMAGIPQKAFILMALPKVGIKTAMKMIAEMSHKELELNLTNARNLLDKERRMLLPYAESIASEVIQWIKDGGNVENIDPLGSSRRKVATVGDIDILAVAKKSKNPKLENAKIMDRFVSYPSVQKIIEKGEHTASILLPGDVQVDILVTEPESYGNALQHFTGSKHHNIKLREFALKKNLSMNETRILDTKTKRENKFKTENEVYEFLGIKYIEPELREDAGELQASISNSLPSLVELKDIKADLQIHSDFDIETSHDLGRSSYKDILHKAFNLNYEYMAFTDHNPSKSGHTMPQIEDILKRKREYIDNINYSSENRGIYVFNSLEIDMGKDGSLPVSVKGLEMLDFALVSIHSSFDLPRLDMTRRVLNALSHPKVKIFAHPTGRKINEREGVELDWEKVFTFCLENNKWIEINADPMRLDLPDSLVREAVKKGIKLTMGTDTHEVGMMGNMQYGINVARRGWCTKSDIVNTRGLKEFREMLQ
jgi:DNA polymerase (family 10)